MSTSKQLKAVYRIKATDGQTYTVDFTASRQGRMKMSGTITGTTTNVSVFIQPKERLNGVRAEIGGTILFGEWIDDGKRLLEMISANAHCKYVGVWERLVDDIKGGWSVPLQWMREYNTSGTRREKLKATNEFATMLRDMAPDSSFDPRTMWDPEEDACKAAVKKSGGKKAKEIIEKSIKKKKKEMIEKDISQLSFVCNGKMTEALRLGACGKTFDMDRWIDYYFLIFFVCVLTKLYFFFFFLFFFFLVI